MFALLRALVVLVVVAAAVAFFMGYSRSDFFPGLRDVDRPAAESPGGRDRTDARERTEGTGEAVSRTAERAGQRAAEAASQAGELLSDAALTAKIKSKMALDDRVSAGNISVDTTDGRVTLTGRVASDAERRRAVELARDTKGIQSVDDRLTIAP